jgi:hypothetical protein
MKFNMGSIDRILRFIVGIAAIGVGYIYESWWGAVGLVPLLTAFVGWCPMYVPFNFSTKKQT